MTVIFRKYNPVTRALTPVNGPVSVVGGVQFDKNALTLRFEYTDRRFLATHKPYIVFDVVDPTTKSYFRYPRSNSAVEFDGTTFTVPGEVMTRVCRNKLSYQLIFVDVSQLVSADSDVIIEQSTMDGLCTSTKDVLLVRAGLSGETVEDIADDAKMDYILANAIQEVTYPSDEQYGLVLAHPCYIAKGDKGEEMVFDPAEETPASLAEKGYVLKRRDTEDDTEYTVETLVGKYVEDLAVAEMAEDTVYRDAEGSCALRMKVESYTTTYDVRKAFSKSVTAEDFRKWDGESSEDYYYAPIIHDLGTEDILVQVTDSDGHIVDLDVSKVDENTVWLWLARDPVEGDEEGASYRVVFFRPDDKGKEHLTRTAEVVRKVVWKMKGDWDEYIHVKHTVRDIVRLTEQWEKDRVVKFTSYSGKNPKTIRLNVPTLEEVTEADGTFREQILERYLPPWVSQALAGEVETTGELTSLPAHVGQWAVVTDPDEGGLYLKIKSGTSMESWLSAAPSASAVASAIAEVKAAQAASDKAVSDLVGGLEEAGYKDDDGYVPVSRISSPGAIPRLGDSGKLDPDMIPDLRLTQYIGRFGSYDDLFTTLKGRDDYVRENGLSFVPDVGDFAIVGDEDTAEYGSYVITGTTGKVTWSRISSEKVAWGAISGDVADSNALTRYVGGELDRLESEISGTYTKVNLAIPIWEYDEAYSVGAAVLFKSSDTSDRYEIFLSEGARQGESPIDCPEKWRHIPGRATAGDKVVHFLLASAIGKGEFAKLITYASGSSPAKKLGLYWYSADPSSGDDPGEMWRYVRETSIYTHWSESDPMVNIVSDAPYTPAQVGYRVSHVDGDAVCQYRCFNTTWAVDGTAMDVHDQPYLPTSGTVRMFEGVPYSYDGTSWVARTLVDIGTEKPYTAREGDMRYFGTGEDDEVLASYVVSEGGHEWVDVVDTSTLPSDAPSGTVMYYDGTFYKFNGVSKSWEAIKAVEGVLPAVAGKGSYLYYGGKMYESTGSAWVKVARSTARYTSTEDYVLVNSSGVYYRRATGTWTSTVPVTMHDQPYVAEKDRVYVYYSDGTYVGAYLCKGNSFSRVTDVHDPPYVPSANDLARYMYTDQQGRRNTGYYRFDGTNWGPFAPPSYEGVLPTGEEGTVFTIKHALNTEFPIVQFYDVATGQAFDTDYNTGNDLGQDKENLLTVRFNTPPKLNSVHVVVSCGVDESLVSLHVDALRNKLKRLPDHQIGDASTPVYFNSDGVPTVCTGMVSEKDPARVTAQWEFVRIPRLGSASIGGETRPVFVDDGYVRAVSEDYVTSSEFASRNRVVDGRAPVKVKVSTVLRATVNGEGEYVTDLGKTYDSARDVLFLECLDGSGAYIADVSGMTVTVRARTTPGNSSIVRISL